MVDSRLRRYECWRLAELLAAWRRLRLVPTAGDDFVVAGRLDFTVCGPDGSVVADGYHIRIRIPPNFPEAAPLVWESQGRIPADYHKLEGGALCLGSPTAVRLKLREEPTLVGFVREFVIPYLFGYSYFIQHGSLPFGELPHGSAGLRRYLADLFESRDARRAEDFLRLASQSRRLANKARCPCGRNRRLRSCHHLVVNAWRKRLGRSWFREEYERVATELSIPNRGNLRPPRSLTDEVLLLARISRRVRRLIEFDRLRRRRRQRGRRRTAQAV